MEIKFSVSSKWVWVYMCASSNKCVHACASVFICQGIDRFPFSVKLDSVYILS